MNNLVYFGLLALVAVISAQELNPGECDPVAYAEVIRGCNSSCGDGTCKSPVNSKPYCECEKAPKIDTSDEKWACTKYYVELEDMMAGQPLVGQECRDRCPAESNLEPYVCEENKGDSLVCVCAPSKSQSEVQVGSSQQGNMRLAIKDTADAVADTVGEVLKTLVEALVNLIEFIIAALMQLLVLVKKLPMTIDNLISKLKDLLGSLPSV